MHIQMEPIGYVRSDIELPKDHDWANVESEIVLQEHLGPALSGLGGFSHLLIVFWMHQAKLPTAWQRRPQGRDDMPEMGLFAQRSRHRPNPIGITVVKLVRVIDNELSVRCSTD